MRFRADRKGGVLGKHVSDWKKANATAEEQLGLLDLTIDPSALMGDLTVVEREIVEIVKAVSSKARIIVMDEPTAAMTPNEVDVLFDMLTNLRFELQEAAALQPDFFQFGVRGAQNSVARVHFGDKLRLCHNVHVPFPFLGLSYWHIARYGRFVKSSD